MIDLSRLPDADRLAIISQRAGFSPWQLQELEGTATTYLVLVARVTRAMGEETGEAALAAALAKTFGTTVKEPIKTDEMPPELKNRVRYLLSERNWLVHNSRASGRSPARKETTRLSTIARIDAISDETLRLH